MATIYQPEGTRTWYSDFQYRGHRIRRSLETEDRAAARRRLKTLREQVKSETWNETEPSWSDAAERFVDKWLPHNVKASTAKRYTVSLRQLTPFFERRRLSRIDLPVLVEYVQARRDEGTSTATIRRDMNVMSLIYKHAIAVGLATSNPVDLIWGGNLLKERRRKIIPPTVEEVRKLSAAASPVISALIRLLSLTGLRLEEALGLTWADIGRQRREIRLTETKTDAPRTVPLTGLLAPAWELLESLHDHYLGIGYQTGLYVFVSSRGDRYAEMSSQYQEIRDRAGLKTRLHDLRHFFAVHFLQDGGDIYTLSKLLGHASVKTTEQHYATFAVLDLHRMVAITRKPEETPHA